jgi:hypothetical protein
VNIKDNERLVRRIVQEVVNERNLGALDEVADGDVARAAKAWIGPFRHSFPDFRTSRGCGSSASSCRRMPHSGCQRRHAEVDQGEHGRYDDEPGS